MSDQAIGIDGLVNRFRRTEALRGLSLRVPRGSVCGFLGRNGAGKTTTIKILMGMLRSDAGAARVLGLDVEDPEEWPCASESDSSARTRNCTPT